MKKFLSVMIFVLSCFVMSVASAKYTYIINQTDHRFNILPMGINNIKAVEPGGRIKFSSNGANNLWYNVQWTDRRGNLRACINGNDTSKEAFCNPIWHFGVDFKMRQVAQAQTNCSNCPIQLSSRIATAADGVPAGSAIFTITGSTSNCNSNTQIAGC